MKRYSIVLLSFLVVALCSTNWANAETSLSEKISKSTQNALNRGLKYEKRRNTQGAIVVYNRALKKRELPKADIAVLKKSLAGQYSLQLRVDEALGLIEGLEFQETKRDGYILELINHALLRDKRYEEAAEFIKLHGTGYPRNSFKDKNFRLQIFGNLNDNASIIQILENYAKAKPDNLKAQTDLKAALEQDNRDAVVLTRLPSAMPAYATRSGHCAFRVTVKPDGRIKSFVTKKCTEPMFKKASMQSLRSYIFLPKLVNGKPVSSKESVRVKFSLTRRDGSIIPEKG